MITASITRSGYQKPVGPSAGAYARNAGPNGPLTASGLWGLRSEGKDYVMQEGDVVERFNV